MTRYKIDATWDEQDGAPVVKLEYARLTALEPEHFQRLVAASSMHPDDEPQAWDVIGEEAVTDPVLMTPKRVRARALEWLREHAGMVPDDSFELYAWVRATRDVLAEIEAAVAR